MKITSLLLSAAAIALCAHTSAYSQTVIVTSSAANPPTPGANDIAYLGGNDNQNGAQDYSNNNPVPGETFTTAASAGGFRLNSVTVQGGTDAGTAGGTTYFTAIYTLRLYSVAGTTATQLASQTFQFSPATDSYNDSYLKFNLATPLLLAGNATYAYAISADGGFYAFNGTVSTGEGGAGLKTTGGQAVGIAGTAITNYAYSRDFDIGLTLAPEPGAWALSIAGFAGLFLLWKRPSPQRSQLPA